MKDHEVLACSKKPTKLRNHINKTETFDSLCTKNMEKTLCSNQMCLGSIMSAHFHGSSARSPKEVLKHADDFLQQYFINTRRLNSVAHQQRWSHIKKEIFTTGTYQLTETELIFGAKLAWRNAARCIGRIQWSKLQVFDCRYVTTTSGMFEALCNHIKYSTNRGNIRSAITVFPQRTDGKHDYRVWNQQLISYAGYKNEDGTIIGDAGNIEFTEICQQLGWKGKRTKFDILPLVLSANGHDPDYFDIPADLVLEVPLSHPSYPWFEKLDLKWYAVPAVSNMVFDCGGLEFTAAPFNGWYMGTEIGSRDLCDVNRYNLLEEIATHMGLDTRISSSLWKDKAMIEANLAVLHSFQARNVTIVDHHTASESFIKHYENEMRLRNGCPADWIWIIPPLSGSATTVFHQEMALYYLKPSYDVQEPAWKSHIWKKRQDKQLIQKKPRRKFHFKQIARAVKFTSKLFGRALSRRIKATVLFATETGKSQMYADKLGELFSHAFHSQVLNMVDYDITNIEHEALLLVITSTFGNGDPPENGEVFAQNLYAMKMNEANNDHNVSLTTSKSFIKANSQTEIPKAANLNKFNTQTSLFTNTTYSDDIFGPLSNVRFAVFALGSSAYPNFCAFGRYVDNLLGELGGERLLPLSYGDEMCGQELAFKEWASNTFRVSCETFCLDDNETFLEATESLGCEMISSTTVRFVKVAEQPIAQSLKRCHNREVITCNLKERTNLNKNPASGGSTLLLKLDNFGTPNVEYKPGDHLGVFACNNTEIVQKTLEKLATNIDIDAPIELQIQKQIHTPNGIVKTWVPHDKYQGHSLRTLFTRFIDITTPPAPNLLRYFASIATNESEQNKLNNLAMDSVAYEDWRHWKFPNLLEVLEEFPSVRPYAPVLLIYLTPLQPRFYSISSSPLHCSDQVHLTVAVIKYRVQGESGPLHYGVCSNFLKNVPHSDTLYVFIRSAPNFNMPQDPKVPMILVGPGTGIAPFRGFWLHRKAEINLNPNYQYGNIWLFFGCRLRDLDLYREEKDQMIDEHVLDKEFLALSREPGLEKTYVQDWIHVEAKNIYDMLFHQKGQFYVCGDCTMAEDVYQMLKKIIKLHGNLVDQEVEQYMLSLRDENRFHEDIFGITLRTAEVHNRSRESARIKLATKPQNF